MLLYANILARKEAEANPTPGMEELKAQIGYSMEAVRGISRDLKSSRLSTVGSFYKEVTTLLEKIKSSARIDFTSRLTNGGHVLSQLQYSNLWKIVNELISNSIKHASCSLITLDVQTNGGELRIEYADDGKGISEGEVSNGIGLQNMVERAKLLNGEFQLRNAYPHGYSVLLLIPIS
jgi:signal transduction histidine kinase